MLLKPNTPLGFAEFIRHLRKKKGWTQAVLAEKVGVSRQWVSQMENGHNYKAEFNLVLRALNELSAEIIEKQD
ncbi:helix-turn-helix transcriptional regulator [Acetobacteraceae bacterium]|nr:helix-turn-helix transcriptional regulator [Acetobacteraceae bacterium]